MNGLRASVSRLESYAGKRNCGNMNGFDHSLAVVYVDDLFS